MGIGIRSSARGARTRQKSGLDARLRRRVTACVRAGELEQAWVLLEDRREHLATDRELALVWLELLEVDPARKTLVDDASLALRRWPDDPAVVTAACAALLAASQRRPPDEPEPRGGPAWIAAEAAEQCLQTLGADGVADPHRAGYLWINRANALRLAGGDEESARNAYDRALELAPERGWWWYDLGLFLKGRGRWQEALDAMLRARARVGEEREVQWNVAICATGVGQGDVAAGVWRRLGIPAEVTEHSGMPIVPDLPAAQIRVPSRGAGTAGSSVPDEARSFEIVQVAPLSPCHGVVQSPTFRDAPVDYGDLVMWDGAPVHVRRETSRDAVPCFPLLARLRPGDERRWRFLGMQQESGEVERLADGLPEGVHIWVHRERVESLCGRCASGEVLRKHEHTDPEQHRLVYGKMVVSPSVDLGELRAALEEVLRTGGKVALAVPGLYEALGDTRAAGQQHKAWMALERARK